MNRLRAASSNRAHHAVSAVEEPLGDRRVGVDAAVAEERPVPAGLLLEPGVADGDHDLLGCRRRPGR